MEGHAGNSMHRGVDGRQCRAVRGDAASLAVFQGGCDARWGDAQQLR